MDSDDGKPPQRKSSVVPLTLLGMSAFTLGTLLPDVEPTYRTLQECEAARGAGQCEQGSGGTGIDIGNFHIGGWGSSDGGVSPRTASFHASERGGFGCHGHGSHGGS